ncbi:MAG TPA: transglutaminase family protein [Verrucomicrobiales bacterium]|nr:transglutaminase family protein [Verrucomicrobiales bacterium]
MAITAAIRHVTHYRYARPIQLSPQVIRLRPAPHCRTPVLSYSLGITPEQHFLNWQQDPHGNYLARVVFPGNVSEFRVAVDLVARLEVYNPFDFFLESYAEEWPFAYDEDTKRELKSFTFPPVDTGPLFQDFLLRIDNSRRQSIHFFVELNQLLQKKVRYLVRMEHGVQTPEDTLRLECGSCRDSAWLLVNILRALGLAARFVSGYLIQLTPDIPSLDGPSGAKEDFTDLHAWAEVYLPGAGWVGMDPTSGLLAAEGHLPVACAPDPPAAAPISGSLEAVETEFEFRMEVSRIAEFPRVTKPYSDAAWIRLNQLGDQIDQCLAAGDVRLTMGGEPTFVSVDDLNGKEWTTGAVGLNKRSISSTLLRRLWKQFSPGGFLHFGQGKWYPGESLPRWSFSCFWRREGLPLWRDPKWLADLEEDYGFTTADAERFLKELARQLEVAPQHVVPAHEDVWYYLWKEQQLPDNVDPLDNRLEDPEERARLAALFERGLDAPSGWLLPLRRQQPWQAQASGQRWESGPWRRRRKEVFLIPGDSPVGLRLPLHTLPHVPPEDYPYLYQTDPMSLHPDDPLPDRRSQPFLSMGRQEPSDHPSHLLPELQPQPQTLPGDDENPAVIRTALCVEARHGKIFAFLPPLRSVDDYLELVAAIESTAAALEMPVILEGERPPYDPRLNRFSITPDPGVLEVNVHPARSWAELRHITETLYEEARLSRLTAEKFLLDGRHTGTGGGNHIVAGGPGPSDSPFLRRPDLLASLIAYWQHHPALSYLFSGLFIGPTSQSPRIDEARDDSLYELEIALAEINRIASEGNSRPWMVDRIFRHLLTDVSGNTHRAEFCIDKLYSPDSSSGRLGLLELRSFEMPPHARMSLAQQLLIRACIARFWETPFRPRRLARWGTALHDRFMLPHFVWRDFQEVLEDLRQAGFPFEEEWFQAHFEFRFPFYGESHFQDTRLELRGALEPWHVLGEENTPGGTARFVDSSVERLQVKVFNFPAERYAVSCNGRVLPLTPTGVVGELVAGVRFRAWQPPSCLHPTLAPDAPLHFDILDRWSLRSVAGAAYHVGHPGGRSYDEFPINSYEAESRRLSRFDASARLGDAWNHIPEPEIHPEFPVTLDLRRGCC